MDVMMFMLNCQYDQLNYPDFVKSVPDVEDCCSMLSALFFMVLREKYLIAAINKF